MVDFRVVMIRTTSQNNAMRSRLLHPHKRFLAFRANVALKRFILVPGALNGGIYLVARRQRSMAAYHLGIMLAQLNEQAFFQIVFLVVGNPRVQKRGAGVVKLVDVQAQGLGIAGNNGAIIVIARARIFFALPLRTRHPNEIGVARQQIHHVPMRHFRRITHRF